MRGPDLALAVGAVPDGSQAHPLPGRILGQLLARVRLAPDWAADPIAQTGALRTMAGRWQASAGQTHFRIPDPPIDIYRKDEDRDDPADRLVGDLKAHDRRPSSAGLVWPDDAIRCTRWAQVFTPCYVQWTARITRSRGPGRSAREFKLETAPVEGWMIHRHRLSTAPPGEVAAHVRVVAEEAPEAAVDLLERGVLLPGVGEGSGRPVAGLLAREDVMRLLRHDRPEVRQRAMVGLEHLP